MGEHLARGGSRNFVSKMGPLMYGIAATLLCVSVILLYWFVRPYFSIVVSCWFCQASTRVPYGNRNCWDCVHCEQYNGFTSDGDYNKPIPSQHEEDLNYPVTSRGGPSNATTSPSKLCERCERNQMLKVRQLANFSPINKGDFDAEVEIYKQKLERTYRLCFPCESRVNLELRRQDSLIKPRLAKYKADRKLRGEKSPDLLRYSNKLPTHSESLCVGLFSFLNGCSLVLTVLLILLCSLYSLPSVQTLYLWLSLTELSSLSVLYVRLHIAGLVLQTLQAILSYRKLGLRVMHFIVILMWLLCYARAILTEHKLLLPQRVMSPVFGVVCSLSLFVMALYSLFSLKTAKSAHDTLQYDSYRPGTPPVSDENSLLSHSSADSGITGSINYATYNLSPPVYQPPSPGGVNMELDCASGSLSSLNIGEPSGLASTNRTTAPCDAASVFSRRHGSVLRKSAFQNSVYPGFSHTLSTYTPTQPNRSPGSISSYHTTAQSNHLMGPSPSHSGYAVSRVPSVSPSGYRSVSGFSPNGSTVYSQPYSVLNTNNSFLPRSTPLSTQILLGVSLGINVSIIAFILGRYSADQPLNPFM